MRKITQMMLQLKEIWIDAWCPKLTETWESSAYQRAIAVDALWLTFMRILEPGSRIKVRNIAFYADEGTTYLHCLVADCGPVAVFDMHVVYMYPITAVPTIGCCLLLLPKHKRPGNQLKRGLCNSLSCSMGVT